MKGGGGGGIQCQEIGLIDLKQAFGLYLFFAEGLNTHENTLKKKVIWYNRTGPKNRLVSC